MVIVLHSVLVALLLEVLDHVLAVRYPALRRLGRHRDPYDALVLRGRGQQYTHHRDRAKRQLQKKLLHFESLLMSKELVRGHRGTGFAGPLVAPPRGGGGHRPLRGWVNTCGSGTLWRPLPSGRCLPA